MARWAYNYFLEQQQKVYLTYLENGETGKRFVSEGEVRKYINNELKPTTHLWLSEVSSNVMKQAVKDANEAYQNYFKGLSDKPRFKSKHQSDPKFYVNYESLKRKPNGFQGEKLGIVKTTEMLPPLPKGEHYSNPRISFDGKYWYLSISYEIEETQEELTGESLGIDLGVKELAVCSNKEHYKNINKTKRVKQLEKKLKREQRKLSRKMEANIKAYKVVGEKRYPIGERPLKECKNIQKQNKVIRQIHRKLNGIRKNYLHQTTREIVRTKPSRIVMEHLHVKGMMKNKHLSKAIAQQKFYEFKRQVKYKCKKYGIAFVEADRFYPSSKKCSCCGNIKKDLKLKDRIYKCEMCGLMIDRDYNASINLANYGFV